MLRMQTHARARTYPQKWSSYAPNPRGGFSRHNRLWSILFFLFGQFWSSQSSPKEQKFENEQLESFCTCSFSKVQRASTNQGAPWEIPGRSQPGSCWLPNLPCLTPTPPPQDQKIYIYTLKGMCPLNMPQQALDTPAVVTCFLAVPVLKKVS